MTQGEVPMQTLSAKELTLGYGDDIIIDDLNITIPKGEITVFIGSNGCGKSTLLRSLARLLKPKGGGVVLDGENIARMGTKDVAKELSILPQGPATPDGVSIMALVKQRRHHDGSALEQWSGDHDDADHDPLDAKNMLQYKDRALDCLSGGQRQGAWTAMTLPQQTDAVALDEPATYLDRTP